MILIIDLIEQGSRKGEASSEEGNGRKEIEMEGGWRKKGRERGEVENYTVIRIFEGFEEFNISSNRLNIGIFTSILQRAGWL